jgi:hypothetical protein
MAVSHAVAEKPLTAEQRATQRELKSVRADVIDHLTYTLTGGPAYARQGIDVIATGWSTRTEPPTAEQRDAVRNSPLGRIALQLVERAFEQKGLFVAQDVCALLDRYLTASGMVYRLRCAALEDVRVKSGGRGSIDLSTVAAAFPTRLELWERPSTAEGLRNEGSHSMEGANYNELIDVAGKFFQTGVRYPKFEKILLETVVHLEYYNGSKALRSRGTGLTTRVADALLMAWAYRKTLGEDPGYTLRLGLGRVAVALGTLSIYLAAASWALTRYQEQRGWVAVCALALLGVLAVRWAGRALVRAIARWSVPDERLAARFVRETPVVDALQHLRNVVTHVSRPDLAPTQLRECIATAAGAGTVHPLVAAYLDRAIAEKEFLWPLPEK